MMTMLMTLVLLILASTSAAEAAVRHEAPGGPDLCVVQTPLVTRLVKAWREETALPTRGCKASRIGATVDQEIHLIRLMNAPKKAEVALEIEWTDVGVQNGNSSGSGRLVLILDAPGAAIRWSVQALGVVDPTLQHSIVVTGDSELDKTDLRTSVVSRSGSNKESRQSLLRFAERRYKKSAVIRSYSQVDLAAGTSHRSLRLRLTLPEKAAVNGSAPASGPAACNYDSTAPSPLLSAWGVQQQPVEGCFHAELAGVYPKDVHVIEVDSSRPEAETNNSDVSVHLAAGWPSDGEGNKSSERNVAVILKSALPVRWLVSSSPTLSGPLLVIAEHPIIDAGLSARQRTELRVVPQGTIPDSFAVLIVWVTSDLGPPVSYVKTPSDTRHVELVINRKQLRIASGAGKQQSEASLSGAASHSSPSMEMGVRSLDRGGAGVSPGVTSGHQQQLTPNSRGGGTSFI